MRLFVDIHRVEPGNAVDEVTASHRRAIEGLDDIRFLRCWTDVEAQAVVFLVEADDRSRLEATHVTPGRPARSEIIEVREER